MIRLLSRYIHVFLFLMWLLPIDTNAQIDQDTSCVRIVHWYCNLNSENDSTVLCVRLNSAKKPVKHDTDSYLLEPCDTIHIVTNKKIYKRLYLIKTGATGFSPGGGAFFYSNTDYEIIFPTSYFYETDKFCNPGHRVVEVIIKIFFEEDSGMKSLFPLGTKHFDTLRFRFNGYRVYRLSDFSGCH